LVRYPLLLLLQALHAQLVLTLHLFLALHVNDI
jgi:hypothetical protein